ncbi:MAG TPA: DUF2867 domain-containing protein [Candidatus Deferrimicrobiaceae bacterium]|nr:DUF2867 domain-containing protein [Candidatus Deferrimicrobiaceae bacterium]
MADRRAPGELVYRRHTTVAAPPELVFAELERMGGSHGWPYADILWRIRGWIDGLMGGVGMRGHPDTAGGLVAGQVLDFWEVEEIERPAQLRLRAEMKVPGAAWLEYEVEGDGASSRLTQTARFVPHGIAGQLYWYGLLPVHVAIFRGMVRRLAGRAVRAAAARAASDNGPLDSGQVW